MNTSNTPRIRVKFLSKSCQSPASTASWRQLLPAAAAQWGACTFSFDRDDPDYDWLIVYDDLPAHGSTPGMENLRCPRAQTLLITTEPSSIKVYGHDYVRQFGHVLSSQEPWALRHPQVIRQQCGLIWFYGRGTPRGAYDALIASCPSEKTRLISTVCSAKQMKHTLHQARYHFTQQLAQRMPELEVFGHGVRELRDKADALDSYRYHIAIENHIAPHHWTEKLADAFLGLCLPFYYGCPEAQQDFPADSLIPIDIHDPAAAESIIRAAIASDAYEQRLPLLLEARELVLQRHGFFPTVARLIEQRHPTQTQTGFEKFTLRSRHHLRRNPLIALRSGWEKLQARLHRP